MGRPDLRPVALLPDAVRRALPAYAAAAVATVVGVGVRVHGHTHASRVDHWIDTRARVTAHPWHGLLYLLAQLGSPAFVALASGALAAVCWWWRDPLAAALCVLAPGVNDVLTEIVLKPVIGRMKDASLAFPSGHTGRAVALATVAVLLAGSQGPLGRRLPLPARRTVRALALAGGAGVGFAVVALGWHYATDAAGAVLLATSVSLMLAVALDRWRAPNVRSAPSYCLGSKSSDRELMQ
jgi:membrane-associated phospholipid phosphatase